MFWISHVSREIIVLCESILLFVLHQKINSQTYHDFTARNSRNTLQLKILPEKITKETFMGKHVKGIIAAVTLAILPLGKWLFPTGKQFFMCNRSAQRKISCGKFPWIRQKEQKNCPWQFQMLVLWLTKPQSGSTNHKIAEREENACCDELCKQLQTWKYPSTPFLTSSKSTSKL